MKDKPLCPEFLTIGSTTFEVVCCTIEPIGEWVQTYSGVSRHYTYHNEVTAYLSGRMNSEQPPKVGTFADIQVCGIMVRAYVKTWRHDLGSDVCDVTMSATIPASVDIHR
jgi:hypothetical protein